MRISERCDLQDLTLRADAPIGSVLDTKATEQEAAAMFGGFGSGQSSTTHCIVL